MSKSEKKPAKKQPAKKAPAKKAVAKKPAKKAPAKKAPAKKAPIKRQAPAVSVTTQPAKTSTTTTDVKVEFSVSGTPAPVVPEVIRVNDVQSKSLRKRMLSWFTRK